MGIDGAIARPHVIAAQTRPFGGRVDVAALNGLLMQVMFPLLMASFALAVSRPNAVLRMSGQAVSMIAVMTAIGLVITALPDRVWPFVLSGTLLVLRSSRYAFADVPAVEAAYLVAGAVLFNAAGALIVLRRPRLLLRQFVAFCALSIPLMAMQMIGVQWTQLLRVDVVPVELGYTQVRTLFVPAGQVVITTLQSRPAGFLYANNATSLVVAFGLALYYGGLSRTSRVTWRDAVIAGVAVLLMSKLVFLVWAVMLLIRTGLGSQARRHAAAVVGIAAGMLGLYRLVFPGLFAANVSPYALLVNFEIRFISLLTATKVPMLVSIANLFPSEILQLVNPTSAESGYNVLVERAWLLLPAAVLVIVLIRVARWISKGFDDVLRQEVAAVALTFFLVPLITSFLETFVFWFLSGAAFLPLWLLVDGDFGAESERVN